MFQGCCGVEEGLKGGFCCRPPGIGDGGRAVSQIQIPADLRINPNKKPTGESPLPIMHPSNALPFSMWQQGWQALIGNALSALCQHHNLSGTT